MGQVLALIEGVELYTKGQVLSASTENLVQQIADRYEELRPFLYRHQDTQHHLQHFNILKSKVVEALDGIQFKHMHSYVMFVCSRETTKWNYAKQQSRGMSEKYLITS